MRRTFFASAALATAVLAALHVAVADTPPSRAQGPALIPTPGAGPVSAAEAQARADFVIYLPTHLPAGVGEPRLVFAPEQHVPTLYVPNRVYVNYGDTVSLWQMPSFGRHLTEGATPVRLGDREGWASEGPGPGKFTVEWRQGMTQLGLTASLPLEELFKIAGSAALAAPEVTMAAPSDVRRRYSPSLSAPSLPPGGIGVILAPGKRPTVMALEPGMPAAKAGVQPGDLIIAVDDRPVVSLTMMQMALEVRGEVGATVELTLQRKGRRRPFAVKLRRVRVPTYEFMEVTLAQLRSMMPFAILTPRWLPPGYRLLACTEVRRDGQAWEGRLVYHAPGKPTILLGETAADADRIVAPHGEESKQVGIGAATATLSDRDGIILSWTQDGTAVLLRSPALGPAGALRIARSMR